MALRLVAVWKTSPELLVLAFCAFLLIVSYYKAYLVVVPSVGTRPGII